LCGSTVMAFMPKRSSKQQSGREAAAQLVTPAFRERLRRPGAEAVTGHSMSLDSLEIKAKTRLPHRGLVLAPCS
jgi:hypothetical protein